MDIMHDFGITVSKEFAKAYLIENKYVRLHDEGIIRIHNLQYYPLYTTSMAYLNLDCVNSDSVSEYFDDIYRIIYSVKKEQTNEEGIPPLDLLLLPISINNLKSIFKRNLVNYLNINGLIEYMNVKQILNILSKANTLDIDISMFDNYIFNDTVKDIFIRALNDSKKELKNIIYDVLKKFLININSIDINMNDNKVTINLLDINSFITDIYLSLLVELDSLDNVYTIFKLKGCSDINDKLLEAISLGRNISISFDKYKSCYRFSSGEKIFENINDSINSSV